MTPEYHLPSHNPEYSVLTFSIARELTLDAAQSARGSRSSTKTLPAAQITRLLDSRHEREVLEGLRKVISVRPACVLSLLMKTFNTW